MGLGTARPEDWRWGRKERRWLLGTQHADCLCKGSVLVQPGSWVSCGEWGPEEEVFTLSWAQCCLHDTGHCPGLITSPG